jgi:hypothetical protein
MSLREIMSEQMVETVVAQQTPQTQEEADLARALALSMADSGGIDAAPAPRSVWGQAPASVTSPQAATFGVAIAPVQHNGIDNSNDDNVDDAAVARQLQAQFDREARALAERRHTIDKNARVRVRYAADEYERAARDERLANGGDGDEDDDDDDEAWREAESDFDVAVGQSHNRARATGAHQRLGTRFVVVS